jgi:hypothetical protein
VFGVYTREAERILEKAMRDAGSVGRGWIVVGSEMIVLAMLDGPPKPDDLARRALDTHAVTADAFVEWLRGSFSEDELEEAERTEMLPEPFRSPETHLCLRRALQLALEEGARVSTEHLLLGVLYERDSFASIGLRDLGFTYEDAHRTIELEKRDRMRLGTVAVEQPPVLIPDPPQRATRGAAVLPELARQVAEEDPESGGRLATYHYLLAAALEGETGDPGGLAGRVLRSFGLSYPVLLARARELSAAERGGLGSDDPDLVSRPPDWPLLVEEPY